VTFQHVEVISGVSCSDLCAISITAPYYLLHHWIKFQMIRIGVNNGTSESRNLVLWCQNTDYCFIAHNPGDIQHGRFMLRIVNWISEHRSFIPRSARTRSPPLHDLDVYTLPIDHSVDMHVSDLVGIHARFVSTLIHSST
jgi:hypothetical protein